MSLLTNRNTEIEPIGWLDIFDDKIRLNNMSGSWCIFDDLDSGARTYGAYEELLTREAQKIIQSCFPKDKTLPLLREALYILTHMGEYDCTQFQTQQWKKKSDNFNVKSASIEMNDQLIDLINDRILVQGLYDPDLIWKIKVAKVSFIVIYPGTFCIKLILHQYTEHPADKSMIHVVGDAEVITIPKDDNMFFESLKTMSNFEDL